MKISEFLKEQEQGPDDLAGAAGVSLRTAYRFISGERVPEVTEMDKIEKWSDGKITIVDCYAQARAYQASQNESAQ